MPLVLFVVVWSLAYGVLPLRLLFAYYIRCSFDCCVLFHCFTTTCSQSSVTIFSQVYAIYPPGILASDWMKKANSGIITKNSHWNFELVRTWHHFRLYLLNPILIPVQLSQIQSFMGNMVNNSKSTKALKQISKE